MVSITYYKGDVLNVPEYTVIAHACNTQGNWGAGMAKSLKENYPYAYYIYNRYCCIEHDPVHNPVPTGTSLLIPPCEYDSTKPKHWIACLFTSAQYGRRKDKPDKILASTSRAIKQLLEDIKICEMEGNTIGKIAMCKINSYYFSVPWHYTEDIIEKIDSKGIYRSDIDVYTI
jgi:ADP-ribose 1''-phosphate phosphatase